MRKADKSVDELSQNISSKNVLLAFDIKRDEIMSYFR